jgi:hypothetical protein
MCSHVTLACSSFLVQAAALLLFNEVDELSYQEVQERLNLPEEDVSRLLHSLSCAKYKILSKEPATKTISKTDKFSFNNKFTDRMKRIKVRFGMPASRCCLLWNGSKPFRCGITDQGGLWPLMVC